MTPYDLTLRPPGIGYCDNGLKNQFIVVTECDQLRPWEIRALRVQNERNFLLQLGAATADGWESVICFCPKDIFRVAKETGAIK